MALRKFVILIGLLIPALPATARDIKFSDFQRDLYRLEDKFFNYCKDNGARYLSTDGLLRPISQREGFFEACGKILDGRALEYTDWTLFFEEPVERGSTRSARLGYRKSLVFKDQAYEVLIVVRHDFYDNASGQTSESRQAEAYLFETGKGSRALWRYSDGLGRDWVHPSVWNENDQQATGGRAGIIDEIWALHVVHDPEKVLYYLNDRRGYDFP